MPYHSTSKPYRPRGQALVEYALIIALIGVGSILALQSLSQSVDTTFTQSTSAITSATTAGNNYRMAQPPPTP